MSAAQKPDLLRTLLETGIGISSELSLDVVLQRIVEAAARVTEASYAALGVIDPVREGPREVRHHRRRRRDARGDRASAARPRHPRSADLIGDAHTLRLHDLGQDPRSVGFPPNHPPMRTFLGTPILLHGVSYGNLYLTEKADGADFDEEDEELVALLAEQAAAIENARLYEAGLLTRNRPDVRRARKSSETARAGYDA